MELAEAKIKVNRRRRRRTERRALNHRKVETFRFVRCFVRCLLYWDRRTRIKIARTGRARRIEFRGATGIGARLPGLSIPAFARASRTGGKFADVRRRTSGGRLYERFLADPLLLRARKGER